MSLFKKRIKINGKDFTSRDDAHLAMQKAFKGCEYYGKNLDALYDVLSTLFKDTVISFKNIDTAKENLGEYADKIIEVFHKAAEENKHLFLKF